jgi:hypothetical protein
MLKTQLDELRLKHPKDKAFLEKKQSELHGLWKDVHPELISIIRMLSDYESNRALSCADPKVVVKALFNMSRRSRVMHFDNFYLSDQVKFLVACNEQQLDKVFEERGWVTAKRLLPSSGNQNYGSNEGKEEDSEDEEDEDEGDEDEGDEDEGDEDEEDEDEGDEDEEDESDAEEDESEDEDDESEAEDDESEDEDDESEDGEKEKEENNARDPLSRA